MSAPLPSPDAGAILTQGPEVSAKRTSNAFTIGVPFAGAMLALLGPTSPTGTTVAVFALFFSLGAVGIGIGLHRYFTHRAFVARPALRWVLGVLASGAWQGSIEQWVADHRRHHRYADRPGDPHSPHCIDGAAPASRLRGLLHAHLTWMLFANVSRPTRYAPDVRRDPVARWCTDHYWTLALGSALAPGLVGLAVGGPDEGLRCLLWAGFVRIAFLQNVTWAIASLGHSFGHKCEGSTDEARDTTLLAVLLFGEGLHSFHHVHPSVGVNEPAQLDLNGAILRLWERWGWIEGLKRVARGEASDTANAAT